jgi:hypothetical protein
VRGFPFPVPGLCIKGSVQLYRSAFAAVASWLEIAQIGVG